MASVFDRLADQDSVVAELRAAAIAARERVSTRAVVGARSLSSAGSGISRSRLGDGSDPETTASSSNSFAMTHAWLFTGPPGSGRSVAAQCFAAALECENPNAVGCGECAACRTVIAGTHADVTTVVPEGLTISVANIRDVVLRSASQPSVGRWQVVIIEDADRLTEAAGNALLKAVEEPAQQTVFLLCAPSTDPQDMMVTLTSRSRHVYVRSPRVSAVASLLQRLDGVSPGQAQWAAQVSGAHIGRARHLLSSRAVRERRARALDILKAVMRPAGGYALAQDLVSLAKKEATERNTQLSESENEELRIALGAGGTGKGTARALRGSSAQLKELEKSQKRRETRFIRDSLDLSLVDLASLVRDALILQSRAQVDLIHVDRIDQTESLAREYQPETLLKTVDAILECRTAINGHVKPELALAGMIAQIHEALTFGFSCQGDDPLQ